MTNPQLELEPCDVEIVRRSKRDPAKAHLEKGDVKTLLQKIRQNHSDTVILKLKDHLMSDINSVVLDEIILTLHSNKVCQALYFQNLSKAMNDEQLGALIVLLKKKKIWCMNLGENYNVSITGWTTFCNLLPGTFVTHLYVSEHVISIDLKNKIRANIRENRKKHDKHCSLSNIQVIERCTNMWWNPINAIRHKFAADIAREEREREEREKEEKENQKRAERESLAEEKAKRGRFKRPLDVNALTPAHSEYWAEGVGEGGDKPWKFACTCGEKCSSYEHFRYHPVGRMFECSSCSIWSHVLCVLGNICDDDLEELPEVLCSGCRSKIRRQRLNELGKAGISLGLDGVPILLKSSQSCDIQSIEVDDDYKKVKHISIGVSATDGLGIDEEMTRKIDDFDTGKYEDVICFPPRTTTAVASKSDSSYSSISGDCTHSQNCLKGDIDSDENINDVCDSESSLRNVLDQRSNSENLLHGENIEIQHEEFDLSMQTDTENTDVQNSGTEKSLIILKNVLSTNGSLGKLDENVPQHIPVDAVITDSIEVQIERPSKVKSYQISKIDALQSLERSDSKCNEKTHQQDNNNIQNNRENCDQHVTKCHRIGTYKELHGSVTTPFKRDISTSSFNELHGSVTVPFRSDMSTSSDASDNCAVVSLSDDDDSNNQSSDRDDEMSTPCDGPSLMAFLNKKRVDVVVIKPENQTATNLAIEIDDFPPPL